VLRGRGSILAQARHPCGCPIAGRRGESVASMRTARNGVSCGPVRGQAAPCGVAGSGSGAGVAVLRC
jgi:hypothetical protein